MKETKDLQNDEVRVFLKDYVVDLLRLMDIPGKVDIQKGSGGEYNIDISVKRGRGLLIGKNGEVLRSIQFLIRTVAKKTFQRRITIVVDIANYRKKRENFVQKKAEAIAILVKQTEREMAMDLLTRKEIRLVRRVIEKIDGVRMYTLGKGIKKNVIIAPEK